MSPRRRRAAAPALPALTAILALTALPACSDSGSASDTTRRPTTTAEGSHSGHKYGSSMDPVVVSVEEVAALGPGPQEGEHWKAVTGVDVCGRFVDVAPAVPQPSEGLSVDPNGRLSLAPGPGDPTGHQVTVADVLALWGMSASTGTMTMPDGTIHRTGDKCEDAPAEVQLWYYTPDAVATGNPIRVVVTDPEKTPIVADGTAFVIALVPESSLPTLPPSALLD